MMRRDITGISGIVIEGQGARVVSPCANSLRPWGHAHFAGTRLYASGWNLHTGRPGRYSEVVRGYTDSAFMIFCLKSQSYVYNQLMFFLNWCLNPAFG
jgi:hypothetical protein